MLDETRIPPVDIETLPDDLREVLEEQRELRGAPLHQQETKRVPGTLRTLLNRRVASWNKCEF